MKELTLQEIQAISLDILKVFDAFCRENGIRYFLSNGTLLGAVRYKKFIPWDDDIDVLVPREDYDRLIRIFRDDDRYRLFAFEKNRDYPFPFAKLCDRTTRKVDVVYSRRRVDLGVNIDIFPLDAFHSDPAKAGREVGRIRRYMACLGYTKIHRPMTDHIGERAVWGVIIALAKMMGGQYFIKKILQECRRVPTAGSAFLGAKAWCMYGTRDIIPAEVFADTVELEFEGALFPAPIGYDTYLRCLYGDYLPEPPKEMQKSHHFIKAYRL